MGVLKSVKRAVEARIALQNDEKRQSFRRDVGLRDALVDSGETIAGHEVSIDPTPDVAIAVIKFDFRSIGCVKVDRARYLISSGDEGPKTYKERSDRAI